VIGSAATLEPPAQVPAKRQYTYEELVAEMPETNQPCELWDGELIMSPTPSYYHQKVALRFYRHLDDWVVNHNLGDDSI
jgi:hypothetical protein